MLWKRNKEMIHFSGRRHTKTGVFSTIIGIFDLLGFVALSIASGAARGNGGFLLGVIGLMLFVLSIFGFVMSYRSFKKKDIFYSYPIIGGVINGFMVILLLILYIIGVCL